MNTAELIQAVHDAGCEFDCKVAGDLYEYLCVCEGAWVMLPAAFAWAKPADLPDNNSRLCASFYHIYKNDQWRIGSLYSRLDTIYDYPSDEGHHERIPVAIELNEGPYSEQKKLTDPGAFTMLMRDLVDEARKITKEIRAVNVREAAKEYEI